MTVEDFILVLRLKGLHDFAGTVEAMVFELKESLSSEVLEHLKRRARQ